MKTNTWPAVEIVNPFGQGPVALICEHASSFIPPELDELGLACEDRYAHAVWDIGARDLACRMATRLDAPLVAGALSRLVYDCNRPPEAADAISAQSELITVPGNNGLSDEDRAARARHAHDPFHDAVTSLLDSRDDWQALITLHSFTPIYKGHRRELDIGFLHDTDARLAVAACGLAQTSGEYKVALNAPYDMSDGVTYTLRKHGVARNLPNVMIEVRNDLINTAESAAMIADDLVGVLSAALRDVDLETGDAA